MFVAWPLYVLHAVLTGTSLALVNALNIKDGFGFSAGLFDYLLNFNIATRPLWLIVIGLGYAVIYYFSFRFVIRWWNLKTPGREEEGEESLGDRGHECLTRAAAAASRGAGAGGRRAGAAHRDRGGRLGRHRRRAGARRRCRPAARAAVVVAARAGGAGLRRRARARRGRGVVRRRRPGRGGHRRAHPPRPRHHDDGREPGHRLAGRAGGVLLLAGGAGRRRGGRRHPPRGAVAEPGAGPGRTSRRSSSTRRRRRSSRLVEAARGHLRMVTLAPERPGALAAIPQLVSAGVVVAVGHTDATYDETRAALAAGATAGTHLFNAMPPLHHREPGPVAALLESSAYLELVADGVHVHPAVLALAWRTGRTALVTDAMAAAGAADGEYRLGSLTVVVRDGVARLARHGRDRGVDRDPGLVAAARRPGGRRTAARRPGGGHLDAGRDARPRGGGPPRRPARGPTWSSCPTTSR